MNVLIRKMMLLAAFALLSGFGWAASSGANSKNKVAKQTSMNASRQIIVYYFHGKARCMSCKKIEAYTEEAVKSNFIDEMKNNKLDYRVVDVEEKGNEHFVKDFELYTKSVVVVDTMNGKQVRWKNLPKVWEFLSDKDAFQAYVRDEIKAYQKAGPPATNDGAAKESGERSAQ